MDTKAAFDREAFEVWVTNYPDMRIDECAMTETLWQAWIAGRKNIEIKLPKEIITPDHGIVISKERTMAALAYNGIKVKS